MSRFDSLSLKKDISSEKYTKGDLEKKLRETQDKFKKFSDSNLVGFR